MIESWGRGFEKIANYCAEENAKLPEIDLSLGGITARCFASDFYLGLMKEHNLGEESKILEGDGSSKSSPKSSVKIIELIKENPHITTEQIAEIIGISKRAVIKNLSKMKDKVIHEGPSNGGNWKIIDINK